MLIAPIMFVILFLIFVFGMGQVAWIYLDSKKREDKMGILWAMFSLLPIFFPLVLPLPIIIYLLVTRSFSDNCSKCGERVSNNFATCPSCGFEIKQKCRSCGRVVKDKWNYCPYCSANIKSGGM